MPQAICEDFIEQLVLLHSEVVPPVPHLTCRDTNISVMIIALYCFAVTYHLVGLVVKASASRAEEPGFESCDGIFSGSSLTSDLKIGTLPCQAPGVVGSVQPIKYSPNKPIK